MTFQQPGQVELLVGIGQAEPLAGTEPQAGTEDRHRCKGCKDKKKDEIVII